MDAALEAVGEDTLATTACKHLGLHHNLWCTFNAAQEQGGDEEKERREAKKKGGKKRGKKKRLDDCIFDLMAPPPHTHRFTPRRV